MWEKLKKRSVFDGLTNLDAPSKDASEPTTEHYFILFADLRDFHVNMGCTPARGTAKPLDTRVKCGRQGT